MKINPIGLILSGFTGAWAGLGASKVIHSKKFKLVKDEFVKEGK